MAGCVKCNFRVFDTSFAPNKNSLFGGMLLNKRSCVSQTRYTASFYQKRICEKRLTAPTYQQYPSNFLFSVTLSSVYCFFTESAYSAKARHKSGCSKKIVKNGAFNRLTATLLSEIMSCTSKKLGSGKG